MKLSEAIRLGAMMRPQAHGRIAVMGRRWFGLFGPVEPTSTCALGAAFEAGHCETTQGIANGLTVPFRGEPAKAGTVVSEVAIDEQWRPVLSVTTNCPQCGNTFQMLQLIPHLNDEHRWLREHIALFVERVENIVSPLQDVAEGEWLEQLEDIRT